MYLLGNAVVEPLGPGSKEKKSALVALGRYAGLELQDVPSKIECGRRIGEKLGVDWTDDCWSTGDTITLTGLNRLVDGAVDDYIASGRKPQRSFLRDLMTINPAPKWSDVEEAIVADDIIEIEKGLLEQIELLAQDGPVPEGVEVESGVEAIVAQPFVEGLWRSALPGVQGWLHLAAEIDESSVAAFDASLGRLLGIEDLARTPRDEYLAAVQNRLELANEYRTEFVDGLEDESEGTVTLATASADWDERWEDAQEENEIETSGPIMAEARTWEIREFREYANEGDLNLSPSYQRADVWPTADAQLLIESVLRGIPLPSVILLKNNDENGDHFEIVDGKQRLTSILRFTGSHPRAIEFVRAKAPAWGWDEEDLVDLFMNDYRKFKKEWGKHESVNLLAKLERELYFPFPLRKGDKTTLSGELEQICGKYYSDIRMITIPVGDETKKVRDLFEKQSKYQIPVIIYSEATPRQIHEVFSLYNRQGKRLNAEEIRNAAFHELDFMRALLVTSGDADDPKAVAPFLMPDWDDLKSTGEALADRNGSYAMPDAGYKRTKALSWIAAALLMDDPAMSSRSTANHISALLKRIQDDPSDPLRDQQRIFKVMEALDSAVDAHEMIPDEVWAPKFKNPRATGRWQELQLVATLIAIAAAWAVRGDDIEDEVEERQSEIGAASARWKRPTKTQSRQQWQFIGGVVREMLEVLGITVEEADDAIRSQFGTSGIKVLTELPEPEWWTTR